MMAAGLVVLAFVMVALGSWLMFGVRNVSDWLIGVTISTGLGCAVTAVVIAIAEAM